MWNWKWVASVLVTCCVLGCGTDNSGTGSPNGGPDGETGQSDPDEEIDRFSEAMVEIVPASDGTPIQTGQEFKVKGKLTLAPGQEMKSEDVVVQIFDDNRVTHQTASAKLTEQADGKLVYETTIEAPLKSGTYSLETWHMGKEVANTSLKVK